MISFPNGKINLGLHIIRKRVDGYHDIETVYCPIHLRDVLESVTAPAFQFTIYGKAIPGNSGDNLCVRAYQILKTDFPALSPVSIHLYKNIPMGAGLGGGSADGAFALRLLNQLFDLNLSETALCAYALQLGSDCPFFISNKPCFARGRGELLEPVGLDLSPYAIALVHPGIHVPTAWAFSKTKPREKTSDLKSFVRKPIEQWNALLGNDFEEPVFRAFPSLRGIKEKLYDAGALFALMTGSGSSFFGIFKKNDLPEKEFLSGYPIPVAVDFIP